MFTRLSLLLLSLVLVTGCARNLSSDVYTESSTVGKVLEGTILSVRKVTIKGSDKLTGNTAGILGGGATGAAVGSAIGKGSGNTIATVGTAIVGGVIGSVVQDKLSTSEGVEYLVKLDPKYIKSGQKKEKASVTVGRDSVANDIKSSIETQDTSSDIIAVVQADEQLLAPGNKVYIVYNDDRPRVVKK